MDKPEKVVVTRTDGSQPRVSAPPALDANGRFAKGNSGGNGRPPGIVNRSTVDMELIRQAIVGSFDKVSGVDKLIALANDPKTFPEYMRIVSWFMPKGSNVQINFPAFIAVDPELHARSAVKFIGSLDEGTKLSPSVVLAALKKHASEESSNGRGS